MCVACRAKQPQSELWRIREEPDSGLALGLGAGRGAYVCQNSQCLEGALTKGRISRALKKTVDQASLDALRKELLCKLR